MRRSAALNLSTRRSHGAFGTRLPLGADADDDDDDDDDLDLSDLDTMKLLTWAVGCCGPTVPGSAGPPRMLPAGEPSGAPVPVAHADAWRRGTAARRSLWRRSACLAPPSSGSGSSAVGWLTSCPARPGS